MVSAGAAKLAAHRAAIVEACQQIAEQRERIDSIVETVTAPVAVRQEKVFASLCGVSRQVVSSRKIGSFNSSRR